MSKAPSGIHPHESQADTSKDDGIRTGSCNHAAVRAEQAPLALARARDLCSRRGERLTPIRSLVLSALYADHRPLSAYELIDRLVLIDGQKRAAVTVYRALDFLIAQGLAHRIESQNAFIACPFDHDPKDVVVFLICSQCGGVDEMHTPEIARALDRIASRQSFDPQTRVLEVTGLCAHCR
jgi:Fur family transcriptional regulator, zinc uptake regulator